MMEDPTTCCERGPVIAQLQFKFDPRLLPLGNPLECHAEGAFLAYVVVVVVVFTLKAVPVSTQYFLTSVLVQLTRTPSVVTG